MKPRALASYDARQFPILYVDDEASNLRIFELTFRREFTVLTAQSAEEGMQVLNDNPVAVVLSDHKMPGMTGVEFLTRVRELDEQAVRILVTAYGDAETLGAAINDGKIYRYVPKPWDPEEMGLTLRRAIERYVLDRERSALAEELTFLNWLARTLHRELDPERVVRLLIDAAHNELGFDGAAVLLFTPDRQALRWASIAPTDAIAERVGQIEVSRRAAPGFFEKLESGTPQVFGTDAVVDAEGPIKQWVSEVLAEEMVVVPLGGLGGVIGALAIDNRSGGRRFGADDRTLLDSLSTQAVIALENARTVAALRSSRSQLETASRMGVLGRLSLGLARDLEGPLDRVVGERAVLPELSAAREQVSGLLAFARTSDASRERGQTVPVDVCPMLEELTALVAGDAARRDVTIAVEVHEAGLPKALADPGRLAHLLLTLVMNAVAVTPAGQTVVLRASAECLAGDPESSEATLRIEVEDRGPGFSPAELEQLFEPVRAPGAGAADLDLVVAHQIVREQGATLTVRSSEGAGATFVLTLPADASSG